MVFAAFVANAQTSADSAASHSSTANAVNGIQAVIDARAEVYPNPVTTSNVKFAFAKQSNEPMLLNIANNLGQVVQTVPVRQLKGDVLVEVTLDASLANGIYYYNITQMSGKAFTTGKFILKR